MPCALVAWSARWAVGLAVMLVADAACGQGLGTYYEQEAPAPQEVWYEPEAWSASEWYTADTAPVQRWRHIDYDYGYVEDEAAFRRYDYDGYHDGYYDGYHGLGAGFDFTERTTEATDDSSDRPRADVARLNHRTAYVNGYQDGSYDRERGYDADPYYYVYVEDASQAGARSNEQRAKDNNRRRGDRCLQFTRRGTSEYETDRAGHRERLRGDVSDLRAIEADGGHLLAQVRFDNGREVVADFGPHMTEQRLPMKPGDRVTIIGRRDTSEEQPVFVANRLIVNEQKYTFRGVIPAERAQPDLQTGQNWSGAGPSQQVTLRGQMAELRGMDDEQMRDADEITPPVQPERTFARLRLQDGQTATLLLAGNVDVDDLAVSTGDQVTVRGREVFVNDRAVIEVSSMLVNGRPIALDTE